MKKSRGWAFCAAVAVVFCATLPAVGEDAWQPAAGPLMTPFAKGVSPDNAHPEYPRPLMTRSEWLNLNGLWNYAIVPAQQDTVEAYDGKILVPFCVESALSGVMRNVGKDNRLWYQRTFTVPETWSNQRVLLHFGAVDWEAVVWVNGHLVGSHRGGYDPFTFDITPALNATGEQEVVVSVWDPTSDGKQPRGKQVNNPHGIWYTPVTGIWQTVWLEPVPKASIARLRGVPKLEDGTYDLTVWTSGAEAADIVQAIARDGETVVARAEAKVGESLRLTIQDPKLWSPNNPFLYDLTVALQRGDETLDQVESYFGMREISLGKDASGLTRMMLNGEFVFQYGTLDQGWWPDGLYTPPTDEALLYDLEVLKKLGFNMLREHVKVAPARFYHHCDRLGLLVWQDMPNTSIDERRVDPADDAQFRAELKAMIDAFDNYPCIVVWVPFNEGWGQYNTEEIVAWLKEYDPTRLVINASGWTDKGVGDIHDIHSYPGPSMPAPEEDRAIVLGEFGGLGLPLAGHTWQDEKNWGYRSYDSSEALTDAYVELMRKLHPLIGRGLSAAVYTQTSDVEIEVNGILTYDRAVIKLDQERLIEAHRKLYLPPPIVQVVVPTSEQEAQTWRYTFTAPGEGWQAPDYDDSSWSQGPGGFGTAMTPGSVVRTEWNGRTIWLRRTFHLDSVDGLSDLYLSVHHDEDVEVYLNGRRVFTAGGFTTAYNTFPLSDRGVAALKTGENVLAVHCRQAQGGQYIDVGIVREIQPE